MRMNSIGILCAKKEENVTYFHQLDTEIFFEV